MFAKLTQKLKTSVLSSFGFCRVLHRVGELNKKIQDQDKLEQKADDPADEGDESQHAFLKEIKLPRIVVIGDENAGKSSTLERIAMVEVLPRNTDICTRQPIVLKLRNNPAISADHPLLKLTIDGIQISPEEVLTASQVRSIISAHMNKLATDRKGIVCDKEIVVEVHSDGVPDLELVDLPGLLSVHVQDPNEPDDIAAMSEACTQKYLHDKDTGVCVCVIDSTLPNLRTSKAIRLVQDAPPALKKYTIGVFAKSDKAPDLDWEEEDCAEGSMWKLEARLRQEGDAKGVDGLESGCVAVVNRNTRKKGAVASLEAQQDQEEMWFRGSTMSQQRSDHKNLLEPPDAGSTHPLLPQISTFGRAHLGLAALMDKIDKIFRKHLDQEYVPKKIQDQQTRKDELQQRLVSMGKNPEDLQLDDLFSYSIQLMQPQFTPANVDILCRSVVQRIQINAVTSSNHYEQTVAFKKMQHLLEAELCSLPDAVITAFSDQVHSVFDKNTTGDIQLHRFPSMRDSFKLSLTSLMDLNKKEFATEAQLTISELFRRFRSSPAQHCDLLRHALIGCVMEFLVLPCLESTKVSSLTLSLLLQEENNGVGPEELKEDLSSDDDDDDDLYHGGFHIFDDERDHVRPAEYFAFIDATLRRNDPFPVDNTAQIRRNLDQKLGHIDVVMKELRELAD